MQVSNKRVARIMRERSIHGASRRKGFITTLRDRDARPAPDLVDRKFAADPPDQLWVADITYVPTLAGVLFVAIVLGVFSRRVVGLAMATHLRTHSCSMRCTAIHQRRHTNVIHHSDQGCQYTSIAFGDRCREAGVRPPMGSVGDCYDNAMCESFNAGCDPGMRVARPASVPDLGRAVLAVFDFIGWYNTQRPHTGLDMLSPADYEKRSLAA
jgi:putative transposase